MRWPDVRLCCRVAVLAAFVGAALPNGAAGQRRSGPVLRVDAALSGVFDNNPGRSREPAEAYGGGGELLFRLASSPGTPLLQLEYAASLRRSSDVNPADGAGHRANALAGLALADWMRLDVIGRGGVDEDLVPVDEVMVQSRLELSPTRSSRLRGYAARRWRDTDPGAAPTLGTYVGFDLRQRIGGGTTASLDLRYEEFVPVDTTRFWHRASLAVTLGQRLARNTAIELEARRRSREYPLRFVDVDDEEVQRADDDWRLGMALVYDNSRSTELRLELQHDQRASTDQRREFRAAQVTLLLRRRIFGLGDGAAPPRVDERPMDEVLRTRRTMVPVATRAPVPFTSLAVTETGVCALDQTSKAVCWAGVHSAAASAPAVVPASPVPGRWASLSAGSGGLCALDRDGRPWCWRWSADGATVTDPQPVRTAVRFTALAVGGSHACGLDAAGQGWCWGGNNDGQLGTGTPAPAATPVQVRLGPGVRLGAISAGSRHTCAVGGDSTVWCWGANESGQAAAGTLRKVLSPRRIEVRGVVEVAAGTRHTCARKADGTVWCWGENSTGQAGQQQSPPIAQPRRMMADAAFTTITAGWDYTCGLDTGGRAWCWGRNEDGQLGIGSADSGGQLVANPLPRPVSGDRAYSTIDAGRRTCALDPRGRLFCWGAGLPLWMPGG